MCHWCPLGDRPLLARFVVFPWFLHLRIMTHRFSLHAWNPIKGFITVSKLKYVNNFALFFCSWISLCFFRNWIMTDRLYLSDFMFCLLSPTIIKLYCWLVKLISKNVLNDNKDSDHFLKLSKVSVDISPFIKEIIIWKLLYIYAIFSNNIF